MKKDSGISFILAIGKPVWIPRIMCGRTFFRFVFGPIALWVFYLDFDCFLARIDRQLEDMEKQLNEKANTSTT